jgi:hypothetical protein
MDCRDPVAINGNVKLHNSNFSDLKLTRFDFHIPVHWIPAIPAAWLVEQKVMQTMVERYVQYKLCCNIQVDDAYLRGELAGGKARL